MLLARWTLLIGWAVVASMCLMLIAGLKQVSEAQAEIASLRQEMLEERDISLGEVRAECDQARARVRMLYAEATGLLNKLLMSVNERPQRRTPGPPVWVDPDRPRTPAVR
jgi:signal transduction histidine kinase